METAVRIEIPVKMEMSAQIIKTSDVSNATMVLEKWFPLESERRLSAVVVFVSFILSRNNLLSDCSNFKCACVTYVTYGDIISNEVHYRLVTELASLAQLYHDHELTMFNHSTCS